MRRMATAFMISTLIAPGVLLAHEGHAHKMMGTVTAVHADMKHVEIKTTAGQAQSFYVNDTTKFLQGSKTLTLSDLKDGQRVVVTATMEGEKMIASEVRVGTVAKAAAKKTSTKTSTQQHSH
jgi:membrane-bound inhibitor of C-type lysozyme